MSLKLSNLLLVLGFLAVPPLAAQTVSVLHSFTNTADGTLPWPKLALSGNTLFGTTDQGGTNATKGGTIFSLGTDGSSFTVLRTLNFATDGSGSQSALEIDGATLYGAAQYGGPNQMGGTIYSMNTNGSNFSVLHNFDPQQTIYIGRYISTNVEGWITTGLLLSGGTLCGATGSGGSGGAGTIFSMATNGSNFTVLHSFSLGYGTSLQGTNWDGVGPAGNLAYASGRLYGVTEFGGTNGLGAVYSIDASGSNFSALYSFGNGVSGSYPTITNLDGAVPTAGLLISGGSLYGTTYNGGANGFGVLFAMNLDGSNFRVLRHLIVGATAAFPALNWVTSGNTAYGAYSQGGTNRQGIIFSTPAAPIISGISFDAHAGPTINFSGAPNNLYFVQAASTISSPGAWLTISANVSDTNGLWQVTDPGALVNRTQFYRAVMP